MGHSGPPKFHTGGGRHRQCVRVVLCDSGVGIACARWVLRVGSGEMDPLEGGAARGSATNTGTEEEGEELVAGEGEAEAKEEGSKEGEERDEVGVEVAGAEDAMEGEEEGVEDEEEGSGLAATPHATRRRTGGDDVHRAEWTDGRSVVGAGGAVAAGGAGAGGAALERRRKLVACAVPFMLSMMNGAVAAVLAAAHARDVHARTVGALSGYERGWLYRAPKFRTGAWLQEEVPRMDPDRFRRNFRVSSGVVAAMVAAFTEAELLVPRPHAVRPLTVEEQLLIALFRYSNPLSCHLVAEMFGVCPTTVSTATHNVTDAILAQYGGAISGRLPRTAAERSTVAEEFYAIQKGPLDRRFRHCIGCVDGTKVYVRRPPDRTAQQMFSGHAFAYCTSVLVVVDARCRFTYVRAGYPGRVHDSRMFRDSEIWTNRERTVPYPFYLLGDVGFASSSCLMTPWRRNAADALEAAFNKRLSSVRVLVEMGIGRWKVCGIPVQTLHI